MLLRPSDAAYATAGISGTMSGRETISFVINMRASTEIIREYTILNIILLDSEGISFIFVADFSATLI